jgi:hypothetical protein
MIIYEVVKLLAVKDSDIPNATIQFLAVVAEDRKLFISSILDQFYISIGLKPSFNILSRKLLFPSLLNCLKPTQDTLKLLLQIHCLSLQSMVSRFLILPHSLY